MNKFDFFIYFRVNILNFIYDTKYEQIYNVQLKSNLENPQFLEK